MDEVRAAYAGDATLARLLTECGSPYDPNSVRSLLAGVFAAPPDVDDDAWTMLAAPKVSPELKSQLAALAATMRRVSPATVSSPGVAADRLARLRAVLGQQGVHGFLVPRADEHQGEYVPARGQRLAWLTGFTGSAGLAVVLAAKAAVFTDGRYTLQVRAQVDGALYEIMHITEQPPTSWIAANLRRGTVLGFDPWLHTPAEVERYRAAAERAGATLRPLDDNPIDMVWADRPPAPLAPVVAHELRFAGKDSAAKRQELAASLSQDEIDAVVLTAPDSIAWLLNVRGGDVPHTPLPLSFAILHRDATVDLFIDRRKLAPGLEAHFGAAVRVGAPEALGSALDRLGTDRKRVAADPGSAASWLFDRLGAAGARVHRAPDPCQLPKARKNTVELEGTRAAHRRDGAALTRFLAWLAEASKAGDLAEIAVSDRLEAFRRGGQHFRGLSFPTISGAGANGAVVHYQASRATERKLEPGSLYLVDSGAQYLDGTTDVTRTVAIGRPSDEMRDRFTRVLKGHIALACCQFPGGTTGSQLDALARRALWEVGLDYDHGTGHGVGSYLGVHEGPQRISKVSSAQPLLPGMIVSNEPGYYKTGAYGIRIENLVVVMPIVASAGEREMFGFETLTLAPIDRACIERDLLDARDVAWLDAYHKNVRETLMSLVDKDTATWLEAATAPI